MKCILVIEKPTEHKRKDPSEIVDILRLCSTNICNEDTPCPYHDDRLDFCADRLMQDAADLIENLIAANKDQSEKLKKIREWIEEMERKK